MTAIGHTLLSALNTTRTAIDQKIDSLMPPSVARIAKLFYKATPGFLTICATCKGSTLSNFYSTIIVLSIYSIVPYAKSREIAIKEFGAQLNGGLAIFYGLFSAACIAYCIHKATTQYLIIASLSAAGTALFWKRYEVIRASS